MSYRKFKAAKIFTGNSWARPGSVLITSKDGKVEGIVSPSEAGEDILELAGILCPGFVNAHCHLELSHLKGQIPPSSGMVPFLMNIMSLRQAAPELIEMAINNADAEMEKNGIVAVGDIANTTHTVALKKRSRLHYHTFLECSGFISATAPERFESAKKMLQQFRASGPASIVPHAPYSVSPELFRLITQTAPEELLSMHNQESIAEQDFFRQGHSELTELFRAIGVDISFFKPSGVSSLQTVFPYFKHCRKILLVHNLTMSQDDLDFIKQAPHPEVFFCLCPSANQYINERMPPLHLLQENKEKIVLGTDSLASNYQLSIIEEMKLLAAEFPSLSIDELLQWATLNGAKALDMEGTLGSFEKGKQPGILHLENWQVERLL